MSRENLIEIEQICSGYGIDNSFISLLNEHGLVEVITIKERTFLESEQLCDLEKIIRMHFELGMNFEGIEVALNLLKRMNEMDHELRALKNRIPDFDL